MAESRDDEQLTGRLVAVAALRFVLIVPPLLAQFDHMDQVFGVPTIWAYLYLVWAVVIVAGRRHRRQIEVTPCSRPGSSSPSRWCTSACSSRVAFYADRRAEAGRSMINNGTVYALSLAVYETAWAFYGNVGGAATTGVGFLAIYLGPTLMLALGWLVLRRIIRISRRHRITSLADFVSARYGKSAAAGRSGDDHRRDRDRSLHLAAAQSGLQHL